MCGERSIPVLGVQATSARRRVLGQGGLSKDDVLAKCREKFWLPGWATDDDADAFVNAASAPSFLADAA